MSILIDKNTKVKTVPGIHNHCDDRMLFKIRMPHPNIYKTGNNHKIPFSRDIDDFAYCSKSG